MTTKQTEYEIAEIDGSIKALYELLQQVEGAEDKAQCLARINASLDRRLVLMTRRDGNKPTTP